MARLPGPCSAHRPATWRGARPGRWQTQRLLPPVIAWLALAGCDRGGAAAGATAGPGPDGATASDSADTPATTAQRPAGSAAAARLSPELRTGWRELVGREPPASFANEDEAHFYAACLPFTQALHERAGELEQTEEHTSHDPDEPPVMLRAVAAVRAQPPPMPAADLAWCARYTTDALEAEQRADWAGQAETTLQAMAGAMAAAYDRNHRLCPSTTAPVPPAVELIATGPYRPDAQAWEGPTWRCLHFRWLRPLRFQYELETAPTRFAFRARGAPSAAGAGPVYELVGTVERGRVELGEVRRLTPAAAAAAGAASASGSATPPPR